MGEGFAGPVLAGGKLLLFHRQNNQEILEALDPATGKRLWAESEPTSYRDDFGFDDGPRSAPAVDAAGRVFAYGAEGFLRAVDLATGKRLWGFNAMQRYQAPKNFFGAAGTPLVAGDRILLNIGGPSGAGIIAFDAATGRELWSFDPFEGAPVRGKQRSRGLVHWNGRIYAAARQWLWALDAKSGKPVPGFGRGGRIDLREGLGRPAEGLSVSISTPGVDYRDLLITGSIVPEGVPSAPGFIRAYHLGTGKLVWTFRTIPAPGDFGYETWPPETWKHAGGANAWGGLALDGKRGIVFAPTGSATYDFYGADRHGGDQGDHDSLQPGPILLRFARHSLSSNLDRMIATKTSVPMHVYCHQ